MIDDHLLNPDQSCVRVTVSPEEYAYMTETAAAESVDVLDLIQSFVEAFALPGQPSNPCIHLSIDPGHMPPNHLTISVNPKTKYTRWQRIRREVARQLRRL